MHGDDHTDARAGHAHHPAGAALRRISREGDFNDDNL
jgi:hypothetical protein